MQQLRSMVVLARANSPRRGPRSHVEGRSARCDQNGHFATETGLLRCVARNSLGPQNANEDHSGFPRIRTASLLVATRFRLGDCLSSCGTQRDFCD